MVRRAGKMRQVQRGSASELLSTTAVGGGDDQRDEPDLVRRAFIRTTTLQLAECSQADLASFSRRVALFDAIGLAD